MVGKGEIKFFLNGCKSEKEEKGRVVLGFQLEIFVKLR